ncbi:sugar phosphate isomerase/epimerase family protein [Pseudalkalibacillus hwajinpoensis]|uniref:Sugar phosphate isomerase/epimerase n=1 Tax=Guptibacillus hwajinpoensis TaxID=208199 RepID=A0A4U1MJB6_9BACL|nr:sugar phosphate isomerase/epimerase [Pseudalkalibacillus hwajinpoensis]TKD70821.1 sugar phosphate isomerase/epimerase [Pseudalkalibacillus hwajinpoensis]
MANIPVAVQMYTLRNECEKDFVGTLERVAKIGYEGLEFAGYYDLPAKELKKVIDHLGLKSASSHIPLDVLKGDLKNVIAYQHEIGSDKLVCPFLALELRNQEGYAELIRSLNDIGRECHEEGITLCYHNHDFELERLSNEKTALETILDETNPEWVKAEFDIYWLTRAGEDPVKWMKQYQDRTPLVHLKDMTTDGEQFFAELGTGGVNLNEVLEQGEYSNVDWWVIEQDKCKRSPFESIEISMNYFLSKHT